MICPTCKHDMIVVEQNKIELDYCTNCHGVWFDAGELELLLSSLGLKDEHSFLDGIFNLPEAQCEEKKRKCPICSKKMMKKYIGKHAEILVDICKRQDGLWFDGGELSCLIKSIGTIPSVSRDSQEQVLGFIGDTFRSEE